MAMFFTQIYNYDNNNKNIYMLIYKKSLKNVYAFLIKLLATAKQLIRRNSICCLKNLAIFHRVSIEIALTPPLPLFVFIYSLRTPPPPSTTNPGFPAGVENMGGSSKFDGEGLSQYMGGAWGVKILLKNTCGGVHFIVKLLAISLQACKFTKNELLHSYF